MIKGALIMAVFLIFASCEKDNPGIPPVLHFSSSQNYTDHDTTISTGGRVNVGIDANASGGNITFFQVKYFNGTNHIYLDSGLNKPSLHYNISIIKSQAEEETWTFTVMDRDRNRDSIRITLRKAATSNYGAVRTYEDILLGAQSAETGSFFSFTTGKVFIQDSAFLNQQDIDLIYYTGQYEATLSSPNETDAPAVFTGTTGISNWLVKNETRFDTTAVTPEMFDQANNDSLIIAAYEPANAKRKGKYIQAGMVISLIDHSGKTGLMKIIAVEPGITGFIRFSLKIQE